MILREEHTREWTNKVAVVARNTVVCICQKQSSRFGNVCHNISKCMISLRSRLTQNLKLKKWSLDECIGVCFGLHFDKYDFNDFTGHKSDSGNA